MWLNAADAEIILPIIVDPSVYCVASAALRPDVVIHCGDRDWSHGDFRVFKLCDHLHPDHSGPVKQREFVTVKKLLPPFFDAKIPIQPIKAIGVRVNIHVDPRDIIYRIRHENLSHREMTGKYLIGKLTRDFHSMIMSVSEICLVYIRDATDGEAPDWIASPNADIISM